MNNQTEIEINMKVFDKTGLLKYLRGRAEENIITSTFHYYTRPDARFYVRIEKKKQDNQVEKIITAKTEPIIQDGVKSRTEVSVIIDDIDNMKQICDILELVSDGEKSKIRRLFIIEGLEVTVDEWYEDEKLTNPLGVHVEIEGSTKSKITNFSRNLTKYASLEE